VNQYSFSGFKLFLLQQGLSTASIESYLNRYTWLTNNITEVTYENVLRFLLECKEKGLKNSSINKLISATKYWGKYTGDSSLMQFKFLKEEIAPKNILSNDEIESFLSLPPTTATPKEEYRTWTFFWALGFMCGLRLGEIARLACEDFDFARNVIRVNSTVKGKTGFRQVPIPARLLSESKDRCENRRGQVFLTRDGRPFNDSIWNSSFHNRLKRLGITKEVKPYSCRDSKATRLAESDVSIFKIMKFMGHKNPKTTLRYVDLAVKDLESANTKDELLSRDLTPQMVMQTVVEAIKSFNLGKDGRFTYSLKEENKKLMFELEVTDK
jgi:integrase/recombinase XerD